MEVFEEPSGVVSAEPSPGGSYALTSTVIGRAPGDYNGDAQVDGTDFLNWQRNVSSTTDLSADGNNDGVVDGLDLAIWRERFGLDFSGPASAGVAAASDEATYETPSELSSFSAGTDDWREELYEARTTSELLRGSVIERTDSRPAHRPPVAFSAPKLAEAREHALRLWSNDAAVSLRSLATAWAKRPSNAGEPAAWDAEDRAASLDEFDAAISRLFG